MTHRKIMVKWLEKYPFESATETRSTGLKWKEKRMRDWSSKSLHRSRKNQLKAIIRILFSNLRSNLPFLIRRLHTKKRRKNKQVP